jgi:hypothetical protein
MLGWIKVDHTFTGKPATPTLDGKFERRLIRC